VIPAVLVAAAAVVVALVTLLAAAGRLRRNSIAGIRIPSLLASDEAWRNGHRAAVLPTAAAAIICVVLAAVVLTGRPIAYLGAPLETVVLVLGVLVGTLSARRAAERGDHG
jgi:hypothetical protein